MLESNVILYIMAFLFCMTLTVFLGRLIIPLLKEINSGVVKNASRATESLKDDSLCLQSMTEWFVEELGKDRSIELEKLCGSPSSIVNRALIRIYGEISGGKTLEATHITAIKELAKKGVPHSSTSLPAGIEALVENGRLYFVYKQAPTEISDFDLLLIEGENKIESAGIDIFFNIDPYSKNIYKKSILLSIASDKIKGALVVRNRRAGDKILSGGVHKSLKKLLNEKKIPLDLRSRIPIICDDDGIVAIPFVAMRDGARVTQNFTDEKQIKITVCIR